VEPWVVIFIVLVLVVAAVVVIAAKSGGKEKKPKPVGRAQQERDIKLRKASPNINVTPISLDPVPVAPTEGNGAGTIGYGNPLDKVGPPALRDRISLLRSEAYLLPEATLFGPGDKVKFRAKIVDEQSNPLEGVPVFWRLHAQRRDLTKPVRTNAEGVAEAEYTVQENDMIEAGSYLVMTYAGSRALLKKLILHDKLQPKIDPNDPFFQGK
jgi:hypothetical protein